MITAVLIPVTPRRLYHAGCIKPDTASVASLVSVPQLSRNPGFDSWGQYPDIKISPDFINGFSSILSDGKNINELFLESLIFLSASCEPALEVDFPVPRMSPQPSSWRFTNNSLGLLHAHSLSFCLFLRVCVVCVCFHFCLSFYLCGAAGFVFGSVFITTFLFSFFFFNKFHRHLCHGAY